MFGGTYVGVCAVDDSSVVVSDYDTSQVFRFNITTGDVMWTCKDVSGPLSVTCYGRRYVLVANLIYSVSLFLLLYPHIFSTYIFFSNGYKLIL